jgi:hypothetical protein
VKNENKPATAEKEKTMKLEEIKNKTNEALSYLVAALESGQSDALTQYLKAMARFRNYSFGNIMLIRCSSTGSELCTFSKDYLVICGRAFARRRDPPAPIRRVPTIAESTSSLNSSAQCSAP